MPAAWLCTPSTRWVGGAAAWAAPGFESVNELGWEQQGLPVYTPLASWLGWAAAWVSTSMDSPCPALTLLQVLLPAEEFGTPCTLTIKQGDSLWSIAQVGFQPVRPGPHPPLLSSWAQPPAQAPALQLARGSALSAQCIKHGPVHSLAIACLCSRARPQCLPVLQGCKHPTPPRPFKHPPPLYHPTAALVACPL